MPNEQSQLAPAIFEHSREDGSQIHADAAPIGKQIVSVYGDMHAPGVFAR